MRAEFQANHRLVPQGHLSSAGALRGTHPVARSEPVDARAIGKECRVRREAAERCRGHQCGSCNRSVRPVGAQSQPVREPRCRPVRHPCLRTVRFRADGTRADVQKLPRWLKSKCRTIVAVPGLEAGALTLATLPVQAARWDGQIRSQAQLGSFRIGEHVGSPPQSLANRIKKDVGWLDHGGRHHLVARFHEPCDQVASLLFKRTKLARGLRCHVRLPDRGSP